MGMYLESSKSGEILAVDALHSKYLADDTIKSYPPKMGRCLFSFLRLVG